MQGHFTTLIKKQLSEEFSFLKKRKSVDVLGVFLSLLLAAVFVGAVGYAFSRFIPVYTSITYNHVYDVGARQYEILTVVYTAVLLTGILSATRHINRSIFESDDVKLLVFLPVKPSALLATKLVSAYIHSLLTTVLVVLPINITFGVVCGNSVYYAFMTVVVCLVLPLINVSIASILALPCYYVKRLLGGKYLLSLILLVVVLGLFFWLYSGVLTTIKTLLENGEISLFFDNGTMTVIIKLVDCLYPANLVAGFLLNRNILFSALILFGIILVCSGIGFVLTKVLLANAMQQRYQSNGVFVFHKRERKAKNVGVFRALFRKEFLSVFRVPSYTFQYFATAIIMPVMVYFSLSILDSMVKNLVFIDCSFELCIFVIIIYSVLTNTFCATNISRDGIMFNYAKTLPFTHRQVVLSKVLFCSIVSVLSLFVCSLMVGCMSYVNPWQAVFIFFISLCLSVAQIAFATRMDFNRPHFSLEEDGEIKESNSTISTIIVLGLIFAVIIGGLSLFLSLLLKLKYLGQFGDLSTYLVASFCAVIMLFSGLFFLLKGLGKKYYGEAEE